MSTPSHHQHTTIDTPVVPPVQFRQCAWCRCRLDATSNPVGEPLPDLPLEASHGICTRCVSTHFPVEARRLGVDLP